MRVLLVASTTGYQVREFAAAARELDYELMLATDRCHVLPDPWGDDALPIDFRDPAPWLDGLAARGPFDGIVAVGDGPARIAAAIAERFGLRYHGPEAARAAADKFLTRQRFRDAGLLSPAFRLVPPGSSDEGIRYPCVLKPLNASGSRGVIRADDGRQFREALGRIASPRESEEAPVLVEDYVPGREFALEGVMTGGTFTTLALFDKPDPLEGPYFEETIYVTPSREPESVQRAIRETAARAAAALGLTDGPVHAEMRVNPDGVWMLEVAARPIGGLCARVLRFANSSKPGQPIELEEILLEHAAEGKVPEARMWPGSHGVMMIPIPRNGVFRGVNGTSEARRTPGIDDIVITAKDGQRFLRLPEGASYLGFAFARAGTGEDVETALREAHSKLAFEFVEDLRIVE